MHMTLLERQGARTSTHNQSRFSSLAWPKRIMAPNKIALRPYPECGSARQGTTQLSSSRSGRRRYFAISRTVSATSRVSS